MNTEACSSNTQHDIISVNEFDNSIIFNAEINNKTISTLIEKLLFLENKIVKKQKKLELKLNNNKEEDTDDYFDINVKPKPIKLYITSNGGSVYHVFSAIDTIRNLKIPVHTICKGLVASAGTLLSISGKKRYITENSYMLIHELRSNLWGKYTHISESYDNCKQLMEHIKNIYVSNTKMLPDELDEQLKKDVYWNSVKCKEKGFVDEII